MSVAADFKARLRARRESMPPRRRRALRAVPAATLPTNIEVRYYRDLERIVVEPLRRAVRTFLLPRLRELTAMTPDEINAQQRADAEPGDPAAALDYITRTARLWYAAQAPERVVLAAADEAMTATAAHNGRQIDKQVKAVLGVNPLRSEPWLEKTLRLAARRNVTLIRTIAEPFFNRVETATLDAVMKGRRSEDIAKMIERDILARTGVDRAGVKTLRGVSYQARRIARDQVSKLNGELSKVRQKALGLTRYTWRTVEDERVRPIHAELNGQVFEWGDPPVIGPNGERGHPGDAVQCRCSSEPLIEDLLADYDEEAEVEAA